MTLPAVRPADLVPSASHAPVFSRYRDRSWLWVTSATALVTAMGVTIGTAAGIAVAGVVGLVAGIGLGVGGGLLSGLHMTALANRRLRQSLRRSLGVRGRGIFVGLRSYQEDLWTELHRKETDDNVGFLEIEEHGLVLTTEAGKVTLRKDDIVGFETERVKAVPMLSFVRVLIDDAGHDATFLIVSREGDSLREQAEATEILRRRLVGWHAEHQLAWLDRHR